METIEEYKEEDNSQKSEVNSVQDLGGGQSDTHENVHISDEGTQGSETHNTEITPPSDIKEIDSDKNIRKGIFITIGFIIGFIVGYFANNYFNYGALIP